jgi:hypothetical protein
VTWQEAGHIGMGVLGFVFGCVIIGRAFAIARFVQDVRQHKVEKYIVFLSFIDRLFGPSLDIAPRCGSCQRISPYLEPCSQKHANPADDNGGCGMQRCPKCNQRYRLGK